MDSETKAIFNFIDTEFQKLSFFNQKELLKILIEKVNPPDNESVQKNPENTKRIAGLHEGKGWISEDFDDELPDEFWGGRV
jgi:hypothetical protein